MGYLIDPEGNIINYDGQVIFTKRQLQENGEIPVPASVERHNFVPYRIIGDIKDVLLKDTVAAQDAHKRTTNK